MTVLNKIITPTLFGCIFWIFQPVSLKAQQEYRTTTYTVAGGLSQSSVFCIAQDKDGFLWVGTQDGLNKFNGLNFQVYRNEPFDSMSLPSSSIYSLLSDSKGRLWVGTENRGLCLFLPEKEQFISFFSTEKKANALNSTVISCISEDHNGMIWIGTNNGLYKIRPGEKKSSGLQFAFEKIPLHLADSMPTWINSIAFTPQGKVLVSTPNALLELPAEKASADAASVRKVTLPGLPASEYNTVQKMEPDIFGNIWVAVQASLFIYETRTGSWKELYTFSPDEKIFSLRQASSGEFWIATSRGLYIINQEDVKNAPQKKPGVRLLLPKEKELGNGIMVIHEDRLSKGLFWAGSDVNGLIKINPVTKKFVSDNLGEITQAPFVFSILEDKPFLWLGTTNGLIRYDESKRKYEKYNAYPAGPSSLAANYVSNLCKDNHGNLWAGTSMGLQRIVNATGVKPSFVTTPVNPLRKAANVRSITADRSGKMIVALPKKVFRYENDKEGFREILDITASAEGKADNVIISSFLEDNEGRYWVGTSGGLVFYNKPGYKPQWYSYELHDTNGLRNNLVQCIRQDAHGNIWVTTFNGFIGVQVIDGKLHFKNYSTRQGLANNTVYGFLEDTATGMLWLSTNGGLSRFDPATMNFVNFDLHDGIQSNEFNANAMFKNQEGEMFFGGVNGYTKFFPSEIKPDTVQPRVLVTGIFQAGGQRLAPEFSSSGKQVVLPYNRNSLSLEFISLQFADPVKNKYAYKLEGLQKDWIYCGDNHQVNFSQLSPGTYLFKVIGSNADGVYSRRGDMLTIIIEPPFWKTIWFYLLLAFLVTVILSLLHRYRLHLKVLQMKEIEKIRRDTAADFHDELGHRLTTISWFSEVMKNKIRPEDKELRSYVDKIIDTSSNLYHTMKDLLWAMDPKKDTVYDLYLQLKSFGEGIFDQTGIDFKAAPAPSNFKNQALPLIYKRHVLLILKEAMHNSFKHSHCTQTQLQLFRENGSYAIVFRDNGQGFDFKKPLPGNGLKNITKRADLIHAEAQLQSGETGTSLVLTFHVPKTKE